MSVGTARRFIRARVYGFIVSANGTQDVPFNASPLRSSRALSSEGRLRREDADDKDTHMNAR